VRRRSLEIANPSSVAAARIALDRLIGNRVFIEDFADAIEVAVITTTTHSLLLGGLLRPAAALEEAA
jgi:hypothetical protein